VLIIFLTPNRNVNIIGKEIFRFNCVIFIKIIRLSKIIFINIFPMKRYSVVFIFKPLIILLHKSNRHF